MLAIVSVISSAMEMMSDKCATAVELSGQRCLPPSTKLMLLQELITELNTSCSELDQISGLPKGPKVVPFWDYLIDSKYEPPKGTTLGPLASNMTLCDPLN